MEKRKHHPGLNRWLYHAIWTFAYALAWGIVAFVSLNNLYAQWFRIDNDWEPLLCALPLALIVGTAQYWLIRRTFAFDMRGWVMVTVVGWLISGILVSWMIDELNHLGDQIVFVSYYLFPAIAQWWLLRKHIQAAWLWILASVVSALVFIVPMSFDSSTLLIALGGALQGILLALVLEWLVNASSTGQLKAKNEVLASAE